MRKITIYIPLLVAIFLLFTSQASAQPESPRIKKSFNEQWQFTLDDPESGSWERVDIPHTWNDKDAFDEEPDYLRTVGWYKKPLPLEPTPGKKYVLFLSR